MSAYDKISEDRHLVVNDYIFSPSRLYFAAFEPNGQFNVYAGESPDDSGKIKVWSTNSTVSSDRVPTQLNLRKGPFDQYTKNLQIFTHIPDRGSTLAQLWASGGSGDLTNPMEASLGDDGRISLRQNQQGVWNEKWNNGFSDPVIEYMVETMEYEKPQVKIKSDAPTGILEQILENDTNVDQTMHMEKKTTTAIVSSWSNATGFKATVGGSVTAGVPAVSSGTVSWSAEFSNTFTFGESTSKGFELGFSFDLTVPAKKTFRGWAQITEAHIEVPYTVFGELHFKSGRRIKHKLSGIYTGKNGDLGRYRIEDITGGKTIQVMEEPARI